MATRSRASQVTATVEKITPELAAKWLEGNVHNRTLRQRRVNDLVGVIQRGEWVLNGDAIRFDNKGVLEDGQHRLWAIVESETAVESLVVRGLSLDAQQTMDTGARRSLRDTLQIKGYPSSTSLAAVINYWWRYEEGLVRQRSARPTIAQGLAVLEANPTLQESWRSMNQHIKRFGLPTGVAAAMHYEFSSIDDEDAALFFERLYTGANLTDGDPILVYRNWLENHRSTGIDQTVAHALGIKAWNFHRAGMKVGHLAWKSTGMHAEEFPRAEA